MKTIGEPTPGLFELDERTRRSPRRRGACRSDSSGRRAHATTPQATSAQPAPSEHQARGDRPAGERAAGTRCARSPASPRRARDPRRARAGGAASRAPPSHHTTRGASGLTLTADARCRDAPMCAARPRRSFGTHRTGGRRCVRNASQCSTRGGPRRPRRRRAAASTAPTRRAARAASKPTVLTMANGNGDPGELELFADAVQHAARGGTLRIEFKNDWRQGTPDYETGVIARRQGGQGRPRLGGHARLRQRRGAVVRRAPRPAADRQLAARTQGAREPARARDARRARSRSASSASASSRARCASHSASRAWCARRTTTARRSRSALTGRQADAAGARRARRGDRLPAGTIEGYDGDRAADRLDRRQRLRRDRQAS